MLLVFSNIQNRQTHININLSRERAINVNPTQGHGPGLDPERVKPMRAPARGWVHDVFHQDCIVNITAVSSGSLSTTPTLYTSEDICLVNDPWALGRLP